ncbi:glutamate decarboxylase [Nonomuraea mesophila]|uniref:Glutamate decarboxylase n=1 Tax=Nonomuraea mesophila TaxID=2530382 RepID=A0A4R5FKR7_9ACTN|nr:glutamate decarboxylase [Nonomuraea mesophila]TDE53225.1 glutamate decarboxylase [Nonomuraea mesophila]
MLRRVESDRWQESLDVNPLYNGLVPEGGVPRFKMPAGPMSPTAAQALIRDELLLDGNARLNLATFCTTWMEPQARELIAETLDRNLVDHDQYPQTADIEARCVNMLDHLWGDPNGSSVGCSTGGSSEAAMLGALAMKFQWRERRRAAGLPTAKPNLVMGTAVHTCWPKFCQYWDVEPRWIPIEEPAFTLNPARLGEFCDDNTIGVIGVLGSTQCGKYDPIEQMSAELDRLEAERGLRIPLHVDAAVGGFITPFLEPDMVWDFRLPRVQSINTSGHKFGLVYPGVGWIVWQEPDALPQDLVLSCDLLGGTMDTFTLNFSRSGAPVIAQYYNFLRLGFEGYQAVQQTCRDVATYLGAEIAKLPELSLIADGSELPVLAVRTAPGFDGFTVFDLAARLKMHGWQAPTYYLPPDLEHIAVIRFVIRNGFSQDTAAKLLANIRTEVEYLRGNPVPRPRLGGDGAAAEQSGVPTGG